MHGALGSRGPGGPLDSQRGAALLALVLALALGSGLVTIEWIEAAARSSHAARRTEAALAAARDALIGYATSYPDQHAGRHGPGYLPCPDTSGNGSPNTPCRATALGAAPLAPAGSARPARRVGRAALVRARPPVPGDRLQAPAAQQRHRRGPRGGRTKRHRGRDPRAGPRPAVPGSEPRSLRPRAVPGGRERNPGGRRVLLARYAALAATRPVQRPRGGALPRRADGRGPVAARSPPPARRSKSTGTRPGTRASCRGSRPGRDPSTERFPCPASPSAASPSRRGGARSRPRSG